MLNFKCIYCNERDADSEEHSFPAAFGMDNIKGFVKLKGKLCKECNRQIGGIEEQFLRCGPEAFFRYILGIKGRKSHDKINPYRRPSSGGKPIKAEFTAPDGPERFLCEQINDSNDFSYLNQIILKDPDGNFHQVIVPDDVNSSESLDKLLADKGVSELEFQAANIDHEKKYIIEGLSFVRGKRIVWNDLPVGHHGKKKVLLSFECTDKYFRAIAKIAFHYFLQYFEHYSGNEPEFGGIKDFVMKGSNVKEWVIEEPGSFVEDYKDTSFFTPNIYCHFVVAEDTGDRIFVKLGFFYGPGGLQYRHFEVQIGKAPGLIKTPKTSAHQILYFEKKDDKGFIGEMKELRRYEKKFLSSLRVPKKEYIGRIIREIKGDT